MAQYLRTFVSFAQDLCLAPGTCIVRCECDFTIIGTPIPVPISDLHEQQACISVGEKNLNEKSWTYLKSDIFFCQILRLGILVHMVSNTHACTYTRKCTHISCMHSHTLSQTHTLSHTHTHACACTQLSHILAHSCTHAHELSHMFMQTHLLTHSHILTHSLTHA